MDDDRLAIERIRSGDIQAYAILVRKYETRVRGYCLGTLCSAADADDAAQEIFIKAYQSLDRFAGRSSFSTWLYRITVNHCRDWLRRKVRTRTESIEKLGEEQTEWLERQLTIEPQVDRPNERTMEVRKALAAMPDSAREVLVLREVHEMSYQETAEALGCSLDAVKARLRRARKELEVRLSGVKRGLRDGA
jgi:RNA polymerase sigma-70 factor (ECF subfamily)